MLKERQKLNSQLSCVHKQLQSLPDGKLICARNGSNYKWYQSDGQRKTYIPKSNRPLAERLAAKKYFSLQYNDLLKKKKAIDYYLRHYPSVSQADQLLSDTSEYQDLLSSHFKLQSQELIDWVNTPYESNTKYPEQLTHKTASGNRVRSKSEALIDTFLYTNKIPFRYECALKLGDITLYPDFTILHPRTRQIYYWEHFGRMDDPAYCKNTFFKLQLYASAGIVPSIRLITTYETKESPLNTELIEGIVNYYFI